MSRSSEANAGSTLDGTVRWIGKDSGFITADGVREKIYFQKAWVIGSLPLRSGERVTFELHDQDGRPQARKVRRSGPDPQEDSEFIPKPPGKPTSGDLFGWAYLGHLPEVLRQLATLALAEDWEFRNLPPDPARPLPILLSYLRYTFDRLVLEQKVCVNESEGYAAFNTGLVDSRYEMIYALLRPNVGGRAGWRLISFCIAGEGTDGQNLVRQFNPLPLAAHYFDSPADLLYDTRMGKPELDWKHVVIERLERYPREFLKDHWPSSFPTEDVLQLMSREQRKKYFQELGEAVERDGRTYRMIMNRVRDAVDLAIKRVAWNFKTAVPQYYPPVRRLQLLLPICLVTDERPDMALAVEKTPVGSYLGHTMLPLDWAYRNARLICRPDSDWLEPRITGGPADEDDY